MTNGRVRLLMPFLVPKEGFEPSTLAGAVFETQRLRSPMFVGVRLERARGSNWRWRMRERPLQLLPRMLPRPCSDGNQKKQLRSRPRPSAWAG